MTIPAFTFEHACTCFQRLVDLTIPDDCQTELIFFPETPLLTEVLVWQRGQRLFSLRLSPDHTNRILEHWQRFIRRSEWAREHLGRPLIEQELRPLARSALLDLLLAMDASV